MNIVVVEHNATLRSFYKSLFNYLRVDADVLDSYEDAINLLGDVANRDTYSHLLLEITGDLCGRNVLKKLKEINPGIKFIAFCNDPFHAIVLDSERYGFNEVLVKPFRIEDLKKALDIP